MTNRQIFEQAEQKLIAAGIDEAESNAWLLFTAVTDMNKASFYLHEKDEIPEAMAIKYSQYIDRRCTHEPLQYIEGTAYFMGLSFTVNPAVLIPRFDTEVLVDEAMKHITPDMSVLDMCTGSGCIGICMDVLGRAKSVIEADISEAALTVANTNIDRLHATHTETVCSDMFSNIHGQFDMIISNPPYIRTSEIDALMSEVKECEPFDALDGHEDGLFFYRILAAESGKYLNPGGALLMEIGFDEAEAVKKLLEDNNFTDIKVIKDLAGLDRVVCGWRK